LMLARDENGVVELQMPRGSGRVRWKALELLVDAGSGTALRVALFDWTQKRWVSLGRFPTRSFVAIHEPGRFVNPSTDTLLAELANESGYQANVRVEVSGKGEVE